MKELTLKDKSSLVTLLEKHYTIKEKHFINAIASNEEEKQTLTLVAYAMGAEQRGTKVDATSNVSTVVINKLCSKLAFVKAIKEAKNIGLREAKDIADSLLTAIRGNDGTISEFCSTPFLVGNSLDCQFSEKQWTQICFELGNGIDWKYV